MNLEEKVKELEQRIALLEDKIIEKRKRDGVVTDYAPQIVKDYIKRDKLRRGAVE